LIFFDEALLFDGGSISRTVLYVKEILTGNLDHKMWGAAPMIVEGMFSRGVMIGCVDSRSSRGRRRRNHRVPESERYQPLGM